MKKGGKQNQKELEAQRQLEEQKRQEEEQRKQDEEKKKYRVATLPTNLQLFLTSFCLQQAWISATPIQFIDNYLKIVSENEELLEFTETDRRILSEQIVYDLVFVKDQAKLEGEGVTILMNILFMLKRNNNKKMMRKGENCLNEKSEKSDRQYLKKLLLDHVEYFKNQQLVKMIFQYAEESYFAYFNLYQLSSQFQKVERTIQMQLFIDQPTLTGPLDGAVYLGVKKSTPEEEEQRMKQEIEEKVQREEQERQLEREKELERMKQLQKEEEERLDPKTQEIIQEKIREAEQEIKDKLQERSKQLTEKLAVLENPKKK